MTSTELHLLNQPKYPNPTLRLVPLFRNQVIVIVSYTYTQ